jgi:hypothetical protein
MLGLPLPANAQEHHHPPQDVQLHEKFYSTWYMPDQPTNRSNGTAETPSTLRQLLQAFTDELKYSLAELSDLFGLVEDEVAALYQLAGHRKPRLRLVV